jgi:peptidoglycan hydrolase CwlO-like protein
MTIRRLIIWNIVLSLLLVGMFINACLTSARASKLQQDLEYLTQVMNTHSALLEETVNITNNQGEMLFEHRDSINKLSKSLDSQGKTIKSNTSDIFSITSQLDQHRNKINGIIDYLDGSLYYYYLPSKLPTTYGY